MTVECTSDWNNLIRTSLRIAQNSMNRSLILFARSGNRRLRVVCLHPRRDASFASEGGSSDSSLIASSITRRMRSGSHCCPVTAGVRFAAVRVLADIVRCSARIDVHTRSAAGTLNVWLMSARKSKLGSCAPLFHAMMLDRLTSRCRASAAMLLPKCSVRISSIFVANRLTFVAPRRLGPSRKKSQILRAIS